MAGNELSHQDSALLFINTLQTELAKTNSSTSATRPESRAQDMPPPQIRHLQKSKTDARGESLLEAMLPLLTRHRLAESATTMMSQDQAIGLQNIARSLKGSWRFGLMAISISNACLRG